MKKLNVIFLVLVFGLLALPMISMPFFRDRESTEKREMAQFPPVMRDGAINSRFAGELDDYVRDHIGFRTEMVEGNTVLLAKLFGESAEDDVVLGQNGWLYYEGTVNDYLNIPTMTERAAKNAAHSLKLLQDHAEANGADFVLAVIPNKNSLYGDNMPARYQSAALEQDGNYELLMKALADEGVNTADVKGALASAGKVLYQRTDTHWTYEGALVGYRSILEAAGRKDEAFAGLTFTTRRNWKADLSAMVPGLDDGLTEQAYPDYTFSYARTSHETAVDAVMLTTRQEGAAGSAVIYRDSFCNTMQEYFAETIGDVLFSRATPWRADYIVTKNADLAVRETGERNLRNFSVMAPVRQAPAAALSGTAEPLPGDALYYEEKYSGYQHLYGTVDESLLGDSYRVYLVTERDGTYAAWEAFPIDEEEKLGAEGSCDNGWSIYLKAEQLDGVKRYLAVESGGRLFMGELYQEVLLAADAGTGEK